MTFIAPKTDANGKGLPFAQQSREFQIEETAKGVAGFVVIDRSGLPVDDRITWYMDHDPAAVSLDEAARAEVRALVAAKVAAEANA